MKTQIEPVRRSISVMPYIHKVRSSRAMGSSEWREVGLYMDYHSRSRIHTIYRLLRRAWIIYPTRITTYSEIIFNVHGTVVRLLPLKRIMPALYGEQQP